MNTSTLLTAAALAVLLTACAKQEDAASPAGAAAASTTTAASAATASPDSGMPQACEDYLARARACLARVNPQTAAAFQDGLEQTRAQWASLNDPASLSAACNAANDAFAQTAAALQCE